MKTFIFTVGYTFKSVAGEYKEYTDRGIVVGNSYAEAITSIESTYDLEDIYELKLSLLRDDGIVFLPNVDANFEKAIVAENYC